MTRDALARRSGFNPISRAFPNAIRARRKMAVTLTVPMSPTRRLFLGVERSAKMGIKDPRKKYGIGDMVKGDCLFAATGVTDGALLDGVRCRKDLIGTETVVMRSTTGTVRWIRAEHRQLDKFQVD